MPLIPASGRQMQPGLQRRVPGQSATKRNPVSIPPFPKILTMGQVFTRHIRSPEFNPQYLREKKDTFMTL